MLKHPGAAGRGAGEEERRRDEETGEGAKGVAREEERRRDEGTGEGAKGVAREEERRRNEGTGEGTRDVARAAGGEAAGARATGG